MAYYQGFCPCGGKNIFTSQIPNFSMQNTNKPLSIQVRCNRISLFNRCLSSYLGNAPLVWCGCPNASPLPSHVWFWISDKEDNSAENCVRMCSLTDLQSLLWMGASEKQHCASFFLLVDSYLCSLVEDDQNRRWVQRDVNKIQTHGNCKEIMWEYKDTQLIKTVFSLQLILFFVNHLGASLQASWAHCDVKSQLEYYDHQLTCS